MYWRSLAPAQQNTMKLLYIMLLQRDSNPSLCVSALPTELHVWRSICWKQTNLSSSTLPVTEMSLMNKKLIAYHFEHYLCLQKHWLKLSIRWGKILRLRYTCVNIGRHSQLDHPLHLCLIYTGDTNRIPLQIPQNKGTHWERNPGNLSTVQTCWWGTHS